MNAYDHIVIARMAAVQRGRRSDGRWVRFQALSMELQIELCGMAQRVEKRLKAYGIEKSVLTTILTDLGVRQ